uniref:Mannosyltransferase n=1 Tax=Timema genevievae TaxID=629358 RepID=A0A7R9K2C9_TIMGE|nr:unnamed protein product [Timema genevievae]
MLRKVEFRGSVSEFAKNESEKSLRKTIFSTSYQDSNPSVLVFSNPSDRESYAFMPGVGNRHHRDWKSIISTSLKRPNGLDCVRGPCYYFFLREHSYKVIPPTSSGLVSEAFGGGERSGLKRRTSGDDKYTRYGDGWIERFGKRWGKKIGNVAAASSHYLLFGKGFQTWEYSPEYALRSYMYLLVHMVPVWVYNHLLQPNRILLFYFCRCLLGLLCAFCEVYFYKSVCQEFGVQVGRLMLAFMVFSAGLFVASTAFIPSTFSMYMCLLSIGAWYQRRYELAIFTTALSTYLSWPFAALLGVPIALDMLVRRKQFSKFFQWGAISTAVILLPMVLIDSSYYSRFVVAPFNILYYNVFTSHGPNLYGTEPWTFYFINGFLNFNFVFVAALLTPVFLLLVLLLVPLNHRHPACLPYWLSLQPLYLWLFVFVLQPHKEERFLFPVYPMICLAGAITVDALQKLWFRFLVRRATKAAHYLAHTAPIMVSAILVCSLLGVSRISALYNGYHAPLDLFMELSNVTGDNKLPADQNINICVGKEWYRFPTSFFLPDNRVRPDWVSD